MGEHRQYDDRTPVVEPQFVIIFLNGLITTMHFTSWGFDFMYLPRFHQMVAEASDGQGDGIRQRDRRSS